MRKIACVGWGSLVWNPDDLPIRQSWFPDGPQACVEFLRQSANGRVTLVLDQSAAPVRALWTLMKTHDIAEAVASLRRRENIPPKNEKRDIGIWVKGEGSPLLLPDLENWTKQRDLDAAIWTNLGPKFNDIERVPTADEVIAYLRGLIGHRRQTAEEYVRKAPVETAYRRKIVEALRWSAGPEDQLLPTQSPRPNDIQRFATLPGGGTNCICHAPNSGSPEDDETSVTPDAP